MSLKYTFLSALCAVAATSATAQNATDQVIYYPGDGVYIVGVNNATLTPFLVEPTLVMEAYKAQFHTANVEMATIKAGAKSYNLAEYFNDETGLLDLRRFMGIGQAQGLVVGNLDSGTYQFGNFCPNKTANQEVILLAANGEWMGYKNLPLGVYDHWDCPVSCTEDTRLTSGDVSTITVDFGNPQEGLVVNGINFPIILAEDNDASKSLTVKLTIWNDDRTAIQEEYVKTVRMNTLSKAAGADVPNLFTCNVAPSNHPLVISTPFEVSVSGFDTPGVKAWLPRAVDTHNLYPSHTRYTYSGESAGTVVAATSEDACINVDGYFNYLGTWGWPDGKEEYGECYATGDLVQIYYDPSDPDWKGDYYMGESAFSVECTFGAEDIIVKENPDWISGFTYDVSQWPTYGCVQLVMKGDALPEDIPGRLGKVVYSTKDHASEYTIYVRQGTALFGDDIDGIRATVIDLPTSGGCFSLDGRRLPAGTLGHEAVVIKDGRKMMVK